MSFGYIRTISAGFQTVMRRSPTASKFASKSLILSYKNHGEPLDVLELNEENIPDFDPSTSNVQVKMLAAPINPADINQIQGRYPLLHPLPCVGGNEVVGEVVAVGDQCPSTSARVGDWVVPARAGGGGAWRQLVESHHSEWMTLPSGLDLPSAATLCVTISTAYRMLQDFKKLVPGEHSVIQNGGNSAVGRAVILLAKAQGISSVSIIRRNPTRSVSDEDVRRELMELGGDVVVFEDELRSLSKAPPPLLPWPPVLGLNCVGGNSALSMAKVLAPKGSLVTYGGMSMEPVTIPTGLLIFKDISCKGFWMTKWANQSTSLSKQAMFEELAPHVRSGLLKSKVKFFDLKSEWRDAFGAASSGKAVLRLSSPSRNIS